MAGPSLSFEVIDEGTRLRMLRSQLHDPRFVLEGIGALLEGVSADAFQDEKLGPVRWKKRSETGMVPNWPGILGHFAEKAGDPPNRFFGDRETLTSTGHLRGSIRSRVVNQNTVEVGTRVHYASVLHTGGESKTARITDALQKRLRAWISRAVGKSIKLREKENPKGGATVPTQKRDAAQKKANMAAELSWLLNPNLTGETLTVTHPARPIVGVPKTLVADVQTIYGGLVESA